MPRKKELKNEELAKVSGGFPIPENETDVIVYYRDTEDGEIKIFNLGDVIPAEEKAKEWCSNNGKFYVGYQRGFRSTNSFDCTKLLNNQITKSPK